MDIKIFIPMGVPGCGHGEGRGHSLSVQKNEKITTTVPILKSNST